MIWLIVVLLALDQITKYLFGNVTNYGAAFGILQGYSWLFILIGFMVIILCIKYYKKYELPLSLLLSGTMGNLIDRIALGYVRDFIDVRFWPVFNLADAFNCVGMGILIWILIKKT